MMVTLASACTTLHTAIQVPLPRISKQELNISPLLSNPSERSHPKVNEAAAPIRRAQGITHRHLAVHYFRAVELGVELPDCGAGSL
jgi:hypothetical protein